jgi:hypothetical protein
LCSQGQDAGRVNNILSTDYAGQTPKSPQQGKQGKPIDSAASGAAAAGTAGTALPQRQARHLAA